MMEAELEVLQAACDRLIASRQTLLLASRAADGNADISYAPYLRADGSFYIFVSELAKHTKNLLAHPQASIMFIEDEAEAGNPFARRRLTLECRAREIPKTDPEHQRILQAMAEKFGDIIGLLTSLPDFHLLALSPNQGQFVAGFGKAFAVDAQITLQAPLRRN